MKSYIFRILRSTTTLTVLAVILAVYLAGISIAVIIEAEPQRALVAFHAPKSERAAAHTTLNTFNQDWIPPVVNVIGAEQTIQYRVGEILIRSNEEVSINGQPQDWTIEEASNEDESIFSYIIKSPQLADGKYEFDVNFADNAGNLVTSNVIINAPGGRVAVTQWTNTTYFDPLDDLLAPANKNYRLPQLAIQADLATLPDNGIASVGNQKIRRVALSNLQKMITAIKTAEIDYLITSGYRSFDTQVAVYNDWLALTGSVEETDSFSARPGHSEHQLGTTLDFVTIENDYSFEGFEDTKLAQWLAKHAHKFGFTMSYPKGKQEITGYTFEPWHYRYVGKELATELKQKNLSLTEWFNAEIEAEKSLGADVVE